MAQKTKLNLLVDGDLVAAFRAATEAHLGRLGLCLSAAMIAFLGMSVEEQAELVQRVYNAESKSEIASLIRAIREEAKRTKLKR